MGWHTEIKRKAFHHLSLVYILMYAFLPHAVTFSLLAAALVVLGLVEFIRLRRPEVNAWFLSKFEGMARESEVLHISGIFWTLLGCWATMVIFQNKKIVIAALGIMTFGDAAAALVGVRYGKHPLTSNPKKTREGSLAFFVVSLLWSLIWIKRLPVVLIGAIGATWAEARQYKWNDNFWVPILSGLFLSLASLVFRH